MLSDAHMGLLLPAKKILDKEAEGTPLRHTVKLEFFFPSSTLSHSLFLWAPPLDTDEITA